MKMGLLIKKVGNQINLNMGKYRELSNEFDSYKGKKMNPVELEAVNAILLDLQHLYNEEIFPFLSFVSTNAEASNNAMKSHELFINDIKALNEEVKL